ncbi:MAG: PD40 domain-containing protein [Candidatus Marinimicrobia bacterium]|nr:PD40 domain-containing protein [Candidatus Neomarinimicrobiota bacterium]
MIRTDIINILTLALLMVSCSDNPTNPGVGLNIIKFGAFFDNPAWHPDGKWIAVEHGDSIDTDFDGIVDTSFSGIWIINAETGYKQPLIRGFGFPAWNQDGSSLAMHSGGQIFTVDILSLEPPEIDTTSLLKLTSMGANFFPSWSSDGKWIAYDSNVDDTKYDIWIMRSDGTEKQNISTESDSADQGGWRIPNWSPDGNWIAHHRYISNGETGTEIYIMDTSGANATWLEHGSGAKFSPDGSIISFYAQPQVGLPPVIWTIRRDGTELRQITNGPDSSFDWSPDGNQIVFLRRNFNEPIEGNGELWLINIDGTNLKQLTFTK